MRAVVVGGGAVGSWIGGSLAAGGADVTLVEPGHARRAALTSGGVRLASPDRGAVLARPAAVASLAEARGRFDVAVVAVRSFHTATVAAELAAVGAPPRVTSFQNGIGNDEVLAAALPGSRVPAATLTTGLSIADDGTVIGARGGGVGLAPPSETADVAAALTAGGLTVRTYGDPAGMKWSKLLLNLMGSATTAILGWPPARVFEDRRLFDVERAAWLEARAVVAALGLRPVALPGYPLPMLARALATLPPGLAYRLLARRLAGARGDRLPGVAADLAAGRAQTENFVLTGAVVARGRALGVPVPVSSALSRLVDGIADGSVPRESYAGRPDALLAAVRPSHAAAAIAGVGRPPR